MTAAAATSLPTASVDAPPSPAQPLAIYLQPTPFLDSNHPTVIDFAKRATAGAEGAKQQAVALARAVREALRYSPWNVSNAKEDYAASRIAARAYANGGHCVDKALLLAAAARALGIPSRLHFANVRNHLGTDERERQLGTDLLVYHAYVELHLHGRWLAATPAFNSALCERLGVAPLDFDGEHDSIFQAFDRRDGRFMEYVDDHGSFADLPLEAMIDAWRRHSPGFAAAGTWPRPARWST